MVIPSLIQHKRDDNPIAPGDWARLIAEYTAGRIPDYQISALLMAVVFRGLTPEELAALTDAMLDSGDRLRFVCHNFSEGLGPFADGQFDHVVSGLSITYAESYDEAAGKWTTAAYDRLLTEVFRVIRPGGRFVFSVNVPEPSWGKVARHSLGAAWKSEHPLRYLKRSWRMMRYGRWLKQEARTGRFHYLPLPTVLAKLQAVGYEAVESRLSFAGQAYLIRGYKPAAAAAQAA